MLMLTTIFAYINNYLNLCNITPAIWFWSKHELNQLFNDSKYIQSLLDDEFNDSIDKLDILELIEESGKVNLNLLYKFYTNNYISSEELPILFDTMNYLNCSRIKELYDDIYMLPAYDELSEEIKYEINTSINKISDSGNYHSVKIERGIVTTFCFDNHSETLKNSPSGKFIQVACGNYHSVGIREDGTVVTWGSNLYRQYNNSPSGKFKHIACGDYSSIGIREDGTVVTWGQYNDSPSGKFKQIACGACHFVGIKEDGKIVTWGNNNWGQYNNSPSGKFKHIDCGDYYSVGIRENGNLVAWGSALQPNTSNIKFKKIVCSNNDVYIAIKEDGTLMTIAIHGHICSSPPGKFIKLACGYNYYYGIREDNKLISWKLNECLILKSYKCSTEKVIQISTGEFHIMLVKEDGTFVFCDKDLRIIECVNQTKKLI